MTYRPKDTKEAILHRLKIARGHLEKVIQMVETHQYCIDVIHQSQAVQRALEETDSVVLEDHLKTCVVDHIKKGETDASIAEIMNVFKKNK
ncbi:metal-sensing transcriptional repressor [Patescibacteria group bacterium]|nr:metal-sensing transcriptional repressor [Patescibacteria group bacterium]